MLEVGIPSPPINSQIPASLQVTCIKGRANPLSSLKEKTQRKTLLRWAKMAREEVQREMLPWKREAK